MRGGPIVDVWAQYGGHRDDALYTELLGITYWTEAEVAEEERLRMELGDSAPSNVIFLRGDPCALCGCIARSALLARAATHVERLERLTAVMPFPAAASAGRGGPCH